MKGFLETVNCLVETTNKRGIRTCKPWRLVHINREIQIIVKECIVDIDLMNRQEEDKAMVRIKQIVMV